MQVVNLFYWAWVHLQQFYEVKAYSVKESCCAVSTVHIVNTLKYVYIYLLDLDGFTLDINP